MGTGSVCREAARRVLGTNGACPHCRRVVGMLHWTTYNGNMRIPIELRREIESEEETAYLLKSETMKRRLLEAMGREEGISVEEACEKLGLCPGSL